MLAFWRFASDVCWVFEVVVPAGRLVAGCVVQSCEEEVVTDFRSKWCNLYLFQEEVVQNGSEPIADGEIETAAQASEADTTITSEKEKEEDSKKKEKKEKVKKKWSFRSISFSKKDKSKPQREDRNGGITKEGVAEVSVMLCIFLLQMFWTCCT